MQVLDKCSRICVKSFLELLVWWHKETSSGQDSVPTNPVTTADWDIVPPKFVTASWLEGFLFVRYELRLPFYAVASLVKKAITWIFRFWTLFICWGDISRSRLSQFPIKPRTSRQYACAIKFGKPTSRWIQYQIRGPDQATLMPLFKLYKIALTVFHSHEFWLLSLSNELYA